MIGDKVSRACTFFRYSFMLLLCANLTLSLLIFYGVHLSIPFPDDNTLTALALAREEQEADGRHIWVVFYELYGTSRTLLLTESAHQRLNADRAIIQRYGRVTELQVIEQLPANVVEALPVSATAPRRHTLADGQEVLFYATGRWPTPIPVYAFHRNGQVIFAPAAPDQP